MKQCAYSVEIDGKLYRCCKGVSHVDSHRLSILPSHPERSEEAE